MDTLRDLSVAYATKQPHQVDALTADAPILDVMPFEAASHGLWNVYETVTGVSGGGFVDLDEALPEVEVASKLEKLDLSVLGGKMRVGEDTARMFGGRDKYFAAKLPKVLRTTGMTAEERIIYKNLLAYAVDHGRLADAGASGDSCYTLLAVRFVPGETTGLYSPEGFTDGAMLQAEAIAGGNLHDIGAGVLGYAMRVKAYLGFQIANPETVSAVVNITATKKPTATMVDVLLDDVRAAPGTYLFCHRKVLSLLADAGKAGAFTMQPGETDVNRRIASWNGVPIVTSYNFTDGGDAHVNVA